MTSPVLFLVFNRPENTRRTFARIREARPSRLYVHADGARPDRPGEAERCAATRAIFDEVDWPCQVFRLFRAENMGLKKGVAGAITWFFENEKMGIVLEDDCLADPSFFPFCTELLEKYADDERVMHISGHNWVRPEAHPIADDYIFSNYAIVSSWASWARAWRRLDMDFAGLDEFGKSERWRRFLPNWMSRRYLMLKFRAARDGRLDTWAFPWFYSVAKSGGLGILPRVNLVENIGISQADATNTRGADAFRKLKAGRVEFPLSHPERMVADPVFDQKLFFLTHKSRSRLWLRTLIDIFKKGG